jgi:putative ABC transport system permease protein
MKLRDTLSLSYRTIRGNPVRSFITIFIIAFGIMALVGINTALEAMRQKFTESFSSMGANGFTIRFKELNVRMGGGNSELKKTTKGKLREKKSNIGKPITRVQAESFKNNFGYPAQIGLNIFGSSNIVASLRSKKTNPNVRIYGVDENYLDLNGFTIAGGRNLNKLDIESGRNVCLIGKDVAVKLFGPDLEKPVDKMIKINSIPFRVVGTLEPKGNTLGMSRDNMILAPYNTVRRFFNSNPNASFSIQVKVPDIKYLEGAIGEAQGTFRPIRKLTTTEEDNFLIDKSDSIVEMLFRNLSFIKWAALIIGMITLLGAAVGLMNIMLVAVTERTKEIGLIKAIGGKKKNVSLQFLFEAILISLIGAGIGIVLGIILGNIVSVLMSTSFVIPWGWVLAGIIICFTTGILAGLYPAIKAGKLNPIEALRYE